ncbi:MAG: VOC family protein [Ruminococcaceae bacterium]|nr:VOC family protein [Oscillospiraceae bacterium]
MKFNSLIPELTVDDIERTKDFYANKLGFRIEYERPENKFVFLSLYENQIMFEQQNGHWSVGELEHPYGRGINFEMAVPDAEALYQRVLEHEIKPFRELMESKYREGDGYIIQHEFLIQDPDGYLLRFAD